MACQRVRSELMRGTEKGRKYGMKKKEAEEKGAQEWKKARRKGGNERNISGSQGNLRRGTDEGGWRSEKRQPGDAEARQGRREGI